MTVYVYVAEPVPYAIDSRSPARATPSPTTISRAPVGGRPSDSRAGADARRVASHGRPVKAPAVESVRAVTGNATSAITARTPGTCRTTSRARAGTRTRSVSPARTVRASPPHGFAV